MSTNIQFGMLQSIKSKGLHASGPNANQQKQNASKAQSVFEEYEQYKTQLAQAQQNGGETAASGNTFAQAAMSIGDIEAKMDECVAEFNRYYTAMNNDKESKPNRESDENREDKNKIQPKEFGGLMA